MENNMSKFKATVLIFDILLGLLLLFMGIRTNSADEISGAGLKTVFSSAVTGLFEKEYHDEESKKTYENEYGADRGDGEEIKKIALTFDDGPHPFYTEQLLDGLKKRGVHVTFFVTGEHAQLHPDVIKRMQEEGHLIGNHTYSHIQLKESNREEYKQELIKTNEVIEEITGEEVLFVRPPYGTWDKAFEKELNMFPVLWSVDPLDWCSSNADCIAKKVEENAGENDIILLHDYYETSVTAALEIVDELLDEGYTFVTVDEILLD